MGVTFDQLSYRLPLSGRRLLNDVSGQFLDGQLTAILGPSGAGKTTLLNAISGYRRRGVEGALHTDSSCYISQEDLLPPNFTIFEIMSFASRLKLPVTCNVVERETIVDELLGRLSLRVCSSTRVNKLSGGQRRRLSIALELINNPPVLFLDEPTSGLDIVSASQLVRLLSKLSHEGRSIVCTIHQPATTIFNLFDRVYFMAEGKCVYQGGPGEHLLTFLEKQGFVCPQHYNPADFVIELMEDKEYVDILCQGAGNGKVSWYRKLEGADRKIEPTHVPVRGLSPDRTALKDSGSSRPPFCVQFLVILKRIWIQDYRNKTALLLQLIHTLVSASGLGILYFQRLNDGTDLQIQFKFILCVLVFIVYTQQMLPIVYYPFEVKLLKKEYFNQWYNLLPYCTAFVAAKTPYLVVLTLLYCLIVYVMAGLPWQILRFTFFFCVSLLVTFVTKPIGLAIGSVCNLTTGSMVGPISLGYLLSTTMYGIDFMKSIHPVLEAIMRTSFMRSGLFSYFFVIYGLDKERLECPEEVPHCLFKDPKAVAHYLAMDEVSYWRPLGDLFVHFFFFWLLFYIALKWKLRR